MLRKLTALTFSLAMIIMVALKHPALAYCTCVHKVMPITDCLHPETPSENHSSCCDKCDPEKPSKPCTLSISFDSGDFLSLTSTKLPSSQHVLLPPQEHLTFLAKNHKIQHDQNFTPRQNAPPPWQPSPALTGTFQL